MAESRRSFLQKAAAAAVLAGAHEDFFRAHAGQPIPRARDWNRPVYRAWIEWNYARPDECFPVAFEPR